MPRALKLLWRLNKALLTKCYETMPKKTTFVIILYRNIITSCFHTGDLFAHWIKFKKRLRNFMLIINPINK